MGDRHAQGVEGERHDDRVEVAVADHRPVGDRHERVVAERVELDLDRPPRIGYELVQRAVHLRGDAEGQRILDRARHAGLVQRAAGQRRAHVPARLDLARERLGLPHHGGGERRVAADRLERQRGDDVRRPGDGGGSGDEQRALADRDPVGRHEREPVLGRELERRDAGAAQRLGAVDDLAADLGAPAADGHERDAGHQRQVARPDRARLGDDRVHARVEHRGQRVGRRRAGPRAAAGDPVQAHGHRRAHDLRRQRRPDAAGVAE